LAAAFLALSPVQVYFSRHFVQEPLLVFFVLVTGLWLFVYFRRPGMGPATGLGLSAGLIHATKETILIIALSLITACLVEIAINPSRARIWWKTWRDDHRPLRDGFVVLGAAATVSFLFYSSFLQHPAGILDAFASYYHGAGKSFGSDHDKAWSYYAAILLGTSQTGRIQSELLVAGLSLIGLLDTLARSRRFSTPNRAIRVIGVASIAQLAIYSIIPYKTPWLLMVPEAGLCILAGAGSAAILRYLASRRLMAVAGSLALAAGLANLGLQARAASYRYAADPRNPLAYVQTVTDLLKVPDRVAGLASVTDRELTIKVVGEEIWPLPWYLRQYPLTGYWDRVPPAPDADLVISTVGFESDLETALKDDYFSEFIGLRPGVVLIVRTQSDLWESYVATLE
jgi:predicted membrane-bound mannosyltransferase